MRVLVLNASPKGEQSHTMAITRAFLSGFPEGTQTELLELRHLNIRPCTGCLGCWTKTPGRCVQRDDMDRVYAAIAAADVVVESFPLYFYGIPGTLKTLTDRCLPYTKAYGWSSRAVHELRDPAMLEKRLVLISTCWHTGIDRLYAAVRTAYAEYAPGYQLNKKAYKVGHWFTNEFDKFDEELYKKAINTAAQAELVIYIGGTSHEHGSDCEGYDKPNLKLPYQQDRLLKGILEVNPNTVVVLISGGPVEIGEWYNDATALLHGSFLGMEGGNALARTLFGEVNPSGKLTTTWCKRLEDMPDHVFGEYPGINDTVRFKEGLMVGYRYFDTYRVVPQFEFGYGLSYTTFTYSNIKMKPVWKESDTEFAVSFTITNTGKRYGQEIAQLYLHQNKCSVERPFKELKGFTKVGLKPDESKQVTIKLPRRALQYYDTESKCWKDEPGMFTVLIGASSRDIKLQKDFELKK